MYSERSRRITNLFRRKSTWLALAAFALLGMALSVAHKRMGAVAAVQDSLNRAWEISFSPEGQELRPPMLPRFVDDAVGGWLHSEFKHVSGYDGSQSPKTRNRHIIYQERFRSIFRGPINDIHIYYPERITGDLGAALARFPALGRFSIYENEKEFPTEADWKQLCSRLRALPNLEILQIGGNQLTDASIAPLAGHPGLRLVSFTRGRLTASCVKTLASLPKLAAIRVEGQVSDSNSWLAFEEVGAFRAALPKVKVDLP